MTLPPQIPVELVSIGELEPHPENPRTIKDEQRAHLKTALEDSPSMLWLRPLIRQAGTGYVIAGNQRLRVAREDLKWDAMPTGTVDLDDKTAREWAIRDNNGFGDWEETALAAYLRDMADLGTELATLGFDQDELDRLLADTEAEHLPDGDTPAREVGADTITQPGDRWTLGNHVLVCGDATNPLAVDLALAKDLPAVIMTDPPYGVGYSAAVGRRANQRPDRPKDIAGDELGDDQLEELIRDSLILAPAPALFVWHSSTRVEPVLRAIRASGWAPKSEIVWVKPALVQGPADYQQRHEPCIYAKTSNAGKVTDRKQTTVWEEPKPSGEAHPTAKPVGLYERAYRNHAERGDVVYDPFAGSGTAAIAAENLGMRARLIELDPAYCDMIVDRWQRHTGETARLDRPNDTSEVSE